MASPVVLDTVLTCKPLIASSQFSCDFDPSAISVEYQEFFDLPELQGSSTLTDNNFDQFVLDVLSALDDVYDTADDGKFITTSQLALNPILVQPEGAAAMPSETSGRCPDDGVFFTTAALHNDLASEEECKAR